MPFNPARSHALDALTLEELGLYHRIIDYRVENGLDPIPLSLGLTETAGRHTADTLYNIWQTGLSQPSGANLHSWSDAPYYSDHRAPEVMWDAPTRLGIDYPARGFEISAAGYGAGTEALRGWKSSPGHNTVILNQGIWAGRDWNAIGIGIGHDGSVGRYGGNVYHVWFGDTIDPGGPPLIRGTNGGQTITGTAFADRIDGLGGRDRILGEGGADSLSGGAGRDRLFGGDQRDRLDGGDGGDRLDGGNGNDRLQGGARGDVLTGGEGRDTFVFDEAGFGRDRITDFGRDRLLLTSEGEAGSFRAFVAASTEQRGNVVYDLGDNGRNVIVLEDTLLADLRPSLFDFA